MNRSEWTDGDDNVVRLLGQPYEPPAVPVEFAQRVQARMLEVAVETARQRAQAKRRGRNRLPALAGVAAMLGIVALGLHFLPQPAASSRLSPSSASDERRAAAPSPAAPRSKTLAPGERMVTHRGERRRVALTDGSVLSLNENTVVRHDAARHLLLDAGEIFVEVAPRRAGKTPELFTVATP
ncbi:MAG TPA: FecR domain-containing protein, partial [Gemmataceae bacterium]|nr:FecR domain-containing protein [Gemmataceae bacterium]